MEPGVAEKIKKETVFKIRADFVAMLRNARFFVRVKMSFVSPVQFLFVEKRHLLASSISACGGSASKSFSWYNR